MLSVIKARNLLTGIFTIVVGAGPLACLEKFTRWIGSTASGGQSFEPSRKSRPMFVFHRDKLHAHTLFGATSLDSGTSAYLTCGRVKKQLNEGSNRRRVRS